MHKSFIMIAGLALAASAPSGAQTAGEPSRAASAAIVDTTLTQLLAEARRANTDVAAAKARLSAARASRRLAMFDLAPSVTAGGSSLRQRQSIALQPGLTSQLPGQQLWDVGFDASWEIDVFGRLSQNVRAGQAFTAAAENGVDFVGVTVSSEVARSYFELRGAQARLAVARRNAENQRKVVKLTESRLEAGRGTAFDTERAKSALLLTLSAVPLLEAEIVQHQQRIGVLLGSAAGKLPDALLRDGPLPTLPDSIADGSIDELIRRRPDVLAAENSAAGQTHLARAARADYLPRLSLGMHAGYMANSFDALSRPGTSRLLAGPVVSFPLLDVGRVRERVHVAQARAQEADAERRSIILEARAESQIALANYDRARARLAILADAVASSTRAADLAQQRFEGGLTDLLQVLDAQRTLIEAENQLTQGHTAAATALVAFYKAVGVGF